MELGFSAPTQPRGRHREEGARAPRRPTSAQVDDLERSDVATTEATYALLARACAAAGDADAATAALARARAAHVAVRRRAYAPVLALRCARGELDRALALARDAAAGGVALGAADHAALLACAGGAGRRDRVPDLLAAYARDVPVARCLLYTSPSPRDATLSRMPSSA